MDFERIHQSESISYHSYPFLESFVKLKKSRAESEPESENNPANPNNQNNEISCKYIALFSYICHKNGENIDLFFL